MLNIVIIHTGVLIQSFSHSHSDTNSNSVVETLHRIKYEKKVKNINFTKSRQSRQVNRFGFRSGGTGQAQVKMCWLHESVDN